MSSLLLFSLLGLVSAYTLDFRFKNPDDSGHPVDVVEVILNQNTRKIVGWEFSIQAKEVWYQVNEAFGNFNFDERTRSDQAAAVISPYSETTGKAQAIRKRKSDTLGKADSRENRRPNIRINKSLNEDGSNPSLHFFGQIDLQAWDYLEGNAKNLTAVGTSDNSITKPTNVKTHEELIFFDLGFSIDEASSKANDCSFPTLRMHLNFNIPKEHSHVPDILWEAKGTTKFLLKTAARSIEVMIPFNVNRYDNTNMFYESFEGEHIVGLGPQYSNTDMSDKGTIRNVIQEQGAGRGEQPLTVFANQAYPYAGGDEWASYSAVNTFMNTKLFYGVVSTTREIVKWEFETSDGGKSDRSKKKSKRKLLKQKSENTTGVLTSLDHYHYVTFLKDFEPSSSEPSKVQDNSQRSMDLLLFGWDAGLLSSYKSCNTTLSDMDPKTQLNPMEMLTIRMGKEIQKISAKEEQMELSKDEKELLNQMPSDSTTNDFTDDSVTDDLNIQPPSWTQNGVILGAEGGTDSVDQKLEKVWKAGVPLVGAWIQDWSGMVTTGFGKRVIWNWRVDTGWYKNWHSFIAKWRNRGVKFLAYINPYLSNKADEIPSLSSRNEKKDEAPSPSRNEIQERILSPKNSSSTLEAIPTMYTTARKKGYLTSVQVPGDEDIPLILPSATDDFRFGLLDLSKSDVRNWYSNVILCNLLMVNVTEYCAGLVENDAFFTNNNNADPKEPMIWGYMSDFGEYLPLSWAPQHKPSNDRQRNKPDNKPNNDNGTRKIFFNAEAHNKYTEYWALTNRLALEKYRKVKKSQNSEIDEKTKINTTTKREVETNDIFTFLRSEGLTSSRYINSFWMGDQQVTLDACDGLQSTMIGAAMSGFSSRRHVHTDVGGYTMMDERKMPIIGLPLVPAYYRSKELIIRWMQYSAFADTVFRTHPGTLPTSPSVQAYDDDIIPHLKFYGELFKKGKAYRKAVALENRLPLLRHGSMVYPEFADIWWGKFDIKDRKRNRAEKPEMKKPEIYNNSSSTATTKSSSKLPSLDLDDCLSKRSFVGDLQIFIGRELIVAPLVWPGVIERTVFIPRGNWKQVNGPSNLVIIGPSFFEMKNITLMTTSALPVFYQTDGVYADILETAYGNDQKQDQSKTEEILYV